MLYRIPVSVVGYWHPPCQMHQFCLPLERFIHRSPMLQLDPISKTTHQHSGHKGLVMAIGGAEDKVRGRQILTTFCQRAGGLDAVIGVIPSASREPDAMGRLYQDIFRDIGVREVDVLLVGDRADAEQEEMLTRLSRCTGIFMSGGDQLRLSALLDETPLLYQLRHQVWEGKSILAGTSAGAAVMGECMIASGGSNEAPNRSLVDLATGLGILPDILVDQHFHNRNRLARLISAISAHPDKLGVGIDEDTCAMFEANGTLRVLGRGSVTIIDPRDVSYTNYAHVDVNEPLSIYNLRLHILSDGDCYDLRTHQVQHKCILPPLN
ncbi:cyanophycinase [Thermosynechococcus sp.]|uniref:cyanophycinase n=1 Tax=Thermosynechococcus sp. TaxID=2814275 RepID=UPI0026220DA4|nr:cyanophycinase [Thermosynechococcus sp.]